MPTITLGPESPLTAASTPPTLVNHVFKSYSTRPNVVIATAQFPSGVNALEGGATCGSVDGVRTSFPQFNTSAAMASKLGFFTWRSEALSQLPAAVGLEALGSNSLDSGPVVSFFQGRPGVPHPSLVWSTLTSHKIITQATSKPAPPTTAGNLTSLWSASRSEQVLCLSAECVFNQQAQGAYVPARVEGWGFVSVGGSDSGCANGVSFPVRPLPLFWSAARVDNAVCPAPDASYSSVCANGFVVDPSTQGSVAGTIPLYSYNKTYNSTHSDWAAVASAEGLAWASGAGYTRGQVLGYVFTAEPTPCTSPTLSNGDVSQTYTMGLSAAVPSVPVGWEYSIFFSVADGGPTAAVYSWGAALKEYHGTTRLPSVTLTDIGYYTDDGG